jgi:hypothetical protein
MPAQDIFAWQFEKKKSGVSEKVVFYKVYGV